MSTITETFTLSPQSAAEGVVVDHFLVHLLDGSGNELSPSVSQQVTVAQYQAAITANQPVVSFTVNAGTYTSKVDTVDTTGTVQATSSLSSQVTVQATTITIQVAATPSLTVTQ